MTPDFEDCTAVLHNLYAFHDHELTDAEADEIRAHLLACEPCLERYQMEDALRLLIRRCCSAEKAPEALRLRVRATWTKTVIITETTD
nr:mycothiol system anti-sigma-R factor [Propionicimonas sp.]